MTIDGHCWRRWCLVGGGPEADVADASGGGLEALVGVFSRWQWPLECPGHFQLFKKKKKKVNYNVAKKKRHRPLKEGLCFLGAVPSQAPLNLPPSMLLLTNRDPGIGILAQN